MKLMSFAGEPVGPMGGKQSLMRRLMDQVGGEDHGVRTQQDSRDVQNHGMRSHERKGREPTERTSMRAPSCWPPPFRGRETSVPATTRAAVLILGVGSYAHWHIRSSIPLE